MQPYFTDATAAAGVRYREGPPFDGALHAIVPGFPEMNHYTGAAAVGDYDGDGFPDLYVSRVFATPLLFRNRGDGTFEDATAKAGLGIAAHWNGGAWADIDNDGDLDLMALTIHSGRHYLFVNRGDGTFEEEALVRGVALDDGTTKLGTSVAVGDYDRDGWLDLHVGEWSIKGLPGFTGKPQFPSPSIPGHTRLFRNRGAAAPGHFEDVTEASGAVFDPPDANGRYTNVYTFANTLADFDDDGWLDLAGTGDFATSRFFWNDQGKFVEQTLGSGLGKDAFGMGAAVGDLDRDGRLDWYVTSISDGPACVLGVCGDEYGNHLYRYVGNRQFEDAGPQSGIYDGDWAWGAAFLDIENDGDLDIAQTNGIDYPFVPPGSQFTVDPNRLWANVGGTFVELAQPLGFVDVRKGRGLVTFDYDRDGDLDVFVPNNAEEPTLFRNDGTHGDWLRIRVLTPSGRDAVGAKLSLTASPGDAPRIAVVGLGTHFLGQSENTVHFGLGLGLERVAELTVRWPDTGDVTVLYDLEPNQELVVTP